MSAPVGKLCGTAAVLVLITAAASIPVRAQSEAESTRATGTIETMPEPPDSAGSATSRGWASYVRHFHGDLEATATVVVLLAVTGAGNPDFHPSMEIVVGTLDGRHGRCTVRYPVTDNRTAGDVRGAVIAGSGQGALDGIAGTMRVRSVEGKLTYVFDYTLPER